MLCRGGCIIRKDKIYSPFMASSSLQGATWRHEDTFYAEVPKIKTDVPLATNVATAPTVLQSPSSRKMGIIVPIYTDIIAAEWRVVW